MHGERSLNGNCGRCKQQRRWETSTRLQGSGESTEPSTSSSETESVLVVHCVLRLPSSRASPSPTTKSIWISSTFAISTPATPGLSSELSSSSAFVLYLFHTSRNQLSFYSTSRTNSTDQIFVYFTDEKSVGVKTMRKSALFSAALNLHAHPSQASRHSRRQVHPASHHSLSGKYDPFSPQSEITGLPDPPQKRESRFSPQVIVAMSAQYRLEEFSEADLLVNIVHHTLVPRHEVLTPDEKKALLEK